MVYDKQGRYEEALRAYEAAMEVFDQVRMDAGDDQARASFMEQHIDTYTRATMLYHEQGQDAQAFATSERGRARSFLDALAGGGANIEGVVTRRSPDAPPGQWASVEQVQAALDNQTTLVAYVIGSDKSIAFVVTPQQFHAITLPVTNLELLNPINEMRARPGAPDAANPESAKQLYAWLIAPLEEHLTTPHLTIVPHSVLHYLPFAALTADGQQFLGDRYGLTILPSATTRVHLARRTGGTSSTPLIVGNPATNREGMPPLQHAGAEARVIAGLYGVEPVRREAATEERVRAEMTGAGVVHLAAHGSFNPSSPLYSAIYLAPSEAPEGEPSSAYDGELQVIEVLEMDLSQTDMVVLSACETQLGELSEGDELVGLTRSFLMVGTRNVIATLWTVDDESTSQLMQSFYGHIQGGGSQGYRAAESATGIAGGGVYASVLLGGVCAVGGWGQVWGG